VTFLIDKYINITLDIEEEEEGVRVSIIMAATVPGSNTLKSLGGKG
jgi:hypothetical protein